MNPYRQLLATLSAHYDSRESQAIAMLVLDKCFGCSRTDIYMERFYFSTEDYVRFSDLSTRLGKGEPVQYVLGCADFDGMRLKLSPDTLIPRPETEDLVQRVLPTELTRAPFQLLDIGTGSGCIALAMKRRYPQADVLAMDISKGALAIAKANAEALGLSIEFREEDILQFAQSEGLFHFDLPLLVFSNPPYVRKCEAASMATHVTDFEPARALFVDDDDPLVFYRAIAKVARRNRAMLVRVEINEALANETADLFRQQGFYALTILTDRFGKARGIEATHLY